MSAYAGRVIATTEQNLAHDSYFYAYVWKGGEIVKVETGSTAYYGGVSVGKADLDETHRASVENYVLTEVEDYITDHKPTVSVEITNGTRVRSLTSKGKAFGVVGKVVGSGSGQYGDFFKVKDDATGRTVIVSKNKVAVVDGIEITSEMWRKAVAITLGDTRHYRKTGEVRVHVSGFARDGLISTVREIVDTLESILSDIGDGKVYATWEDYMTDVASTHDMGYVGKLADRIAL